VTPSGAWARPSGNGLESNAPGRRAGDYVSPANHRATDWGQTCDLRRHNPLTPVSGVSQCCRISLSKPISLLKVARCFGVLCPEWCQRSISTPICC
jgi:hypothetical protein